MKGQRWSRQGRALSRLVGLTLLALSASLLLVAAPADGVVTIGSDLTNSPTSGTSSFPITITQIVPAGRSFVSPIDGVVVRWRVLNPVGGSMRARVLHSTDGGATFTGVATGPAQTSPDGGAVPFPLDPGLPIKAGDYFGVDQLSDSALSFSNIVPPATTLGRWNPPLGDGASPLAPATSNYELLVNADVEPDADCDGLGDETQDPIVAGGCLPAAAVTRPQPRGVALISGKAFTNGKSLALQVSCAPAGGNCDSNQVALVTAKPVSLDTARSAAKRKRVALGTASFSVSAGQTQTVRVPLTKQGRKLFKLRRKVAATATITSGGTSSTVTVTIELKGTKKR